MSRGAKELLEIIRQLYPCQKIELEYNIADKGALFLDIYLPQLKIGFEYDGELHFHYNEHFHGTRENFIRAQKRDFEKDERCEVLGITLVRVAYNEEMTKASVLNKLERVLNG